MGVLVDPGTGHLRLRIEPGIESLLPEDSAERAFLAETQRRFGSDDSLVLGFASEALFTTDVLQRIDRLTHRLAAMEEIRRVTSLTNAVNVVGTEDGIDIGPFVSEIPSDPAGLAALRDAVMNNPVTAGSLVARDEGATALLLTLVPLTSREYRERGVSDRILEIAHEEAGDAEIWLTGGPHLGAANARVLVRETLFLPTLILGAMALVLIMAFRTIRGVLVPLVTVAVAVLWTLALAELIGHELNAITVLMPALLMTLGLSYAIHVVSEYYEVEAEHPPARAALAARLALQTRGHQLGEVFARREPRWSEHVLVDEASLGDPELQASLLALGIDEQTLRALGLIPLVQVAWADGQLDDKERAAILEAAQSLGLDRDARSMQLLSERLAGPPDERLFQAWRGYVETLLSQLSVEGRLRLQETVLMRARGVAQAAGGVAGLRSVSRSEETELRRLADVFEAAGD